MDKNKVKSTNEEVKTEKKKVKKSSQKSSQKSSSNKLNFKYLGGLLFKKMARGGANELGSNADEVNKLNVFPVPDGDTGDNMHMTIESGISAIENTNTDNLADVMKALSRGMLLGARGNSGVILSQFFAGTAKGLEKSKKADPEILGHALEMGVKQAYSSVMTPTEGTILTVAREAVEYAVSKIKPTSTIRSFFADLVKEMHASLERTPDILTVLKDAKVVDSGGAGLFYIMDGFYRVLNGEEIPKDTASIVAQKPAALPTESGFGPNSEMTYGYCTELLLQLQNSKTNIDEFDVETLKAFLAEIGDSIVAFKTESIVKLHVHTFTPEKVLAHCRQFGEFLTVKIENMSVQHTETAESTNKAEEQANDTVSNNTPVQNEAKMYGVVAVCTGAGVENLYREFGADEVIQGGQTKNPSTNDFLESFEKINAEHIFVFPNNGNIFMAAQQAADLYDKAKIHVIPSKNIGTGYVALSSADFENTNVDEIISEMQNAMIRVTAGYISPSIRDADMNGVHINNGDTIGIIDKEIVVSESERVDAVKGLVSALLSSGTKTMLTVFCGIDAEENEKLEIEHILSGLYAETEIYFIDGGQDIYPYIFVAE